METTQPTPFEEPSAASSPLLRLVDRFIPEEVKRWPPGRLRRIRLSVGAALALLFVNATAAFPYTLILRGLSFDLALMAFGAAVCVTCVLLPRWVQSDTLPGLIFCLHAVAVIIGASFTTGPIALAGPYWHIVVPLAAAFLGGSRVMALCTSISLAHFLFLIVRSASLAPLASNPELWGHLNALNLTLFSGSLSWLFEKARERSELEEERRHRDERRRLQNELEIATRIQASILPRVLQVPGLEIAARMVPASEVGGDYYDVLPIEGGCWVGIGDVSGHGLDAGLIMMMLQSTIASLSRQSPRAAPRELLNLSNQVLFHNIRSRLGRDDYITLALLRYSQDGEVVLSGAHEPPLLYRSRERRCETVETRGAWIGAMKSVERFTVDTRARLEVGDVMLLYTDGLTEAMNEQGEQFGPERLAAELERVHQAPVDELADHLLGCVRRWTKAPQDDLTLVVLRHRGGEQPGVVLPLQRSA